MSRKNRNKYKQISEPLLYFPQAPMESPLTSLPKTGPPLQNGSQLSLMLPDPKLTQTGEVAMFRKALIPLHR